MLPELRALYEKEADGVFALLSRFGLSGADLEDAVHDTFVTALSRAQSFDASRPVAPWLLGIAFRVGVSRLRSRRESTTEIPELSDPSQDPQRAAEMREAQLLLQRALLELSDEQGAVFVLFDLHGVSAEEISRSMDVPVKTTYSRLRLARQGLQAAVDRLLAKERAR